MAISANAVWEVRTGGSDNNGGGFDPSVTSPGTDYSQQNSAQVAFNGTSITATTGGVSDTITITGYTVASTDNGNMLNITGGTNFTTGIYTIIAVNTGASTWQLDRNCTTGAGAAMTGNMGGGFLTVAKGVSSTGPIVAGNSCWIKSGTYTITAGITTVAGASTLETAIMGYNTTRGDLDNVYDFTNFPNIVDNNVNIIMMTVSAFNRVRNLVVDAGSGGTKASTGFSASGGNSGIRFFNCKATGTFATNGGFQINAVGILERCYVTGCSSSNGAFQSNNASAKFIDCLAADNTTSGFVTSAAAGGTYIRCISDSNSGGTSDGFKATSTGASYINCVAYNNGQHGINLSAATSGDNAAIANCILEGNGGYGIKSSTSTYNNIYEKYNAFYNNSSGQVNGVTASPDATDITLTGSPFVNAASQNFALNNTASAGAACRAAGIPGTFPPGTTVSYLDIGAAQHQDTGGGTGGSYTFVG